ncbi:uncharacterized protein LOC135464582 [Liolophura sinensis]|uniref:uncharacterized protein LOC135464582 n=1 Tax=Liolophura sinensis TaxID=3198878 RepID=UPI00315915F0
MDYFLLATLIMYSLCSNVVDNVVTNECRRGGPPDGLCITKNTTQNWHVAREICAADGLTLASLTPDMTENLNITNVWVGGRTLRAWSRDNSLFYFGQWTGCVNNSYHTANIRENTTLSECLQSCSLFRRALLNKTHCVCTNIGSREVNKKLDGCTDPLKWTSGHGNKTHVFSMRSKNMTENRNGSETLTVSNNFSIEFRISNGRLHALCQSTDNMSAIRSVPYGNSGTFLWTSDKTVPFEYAGDHCEKSGGTLAKLDWGSDLLGRELFELLKDTQVWIGVSRLNWRFLDGTKVSSLWLNFTPSLDNGCLIWNQTGLATTQCFQNASKGLYGLCGGKKPRVATATPGPKVSSTTQSRTLPAMVGSNSLLGVYIGVGVSAGILLVVGIVLIVVCRVRGSRRTDRSSSLDYQTEYTDDGYAVISPDQTAGSMTANLAEGDTQTSNINQRDSFAGISFFGDQINPAYGHLSIPNAKRTRGIDTSSTYYHVADEAGRGDGVGQND